jgi:hypothetical protein
MSHIYSICSRVRTLCWRERVLIMESTIKEGMMGEGTKGKGSMGDGTTREGVFEEEGLEKRGREDGFFADESDYGEN